MNTLILTSKLENLGYEIDGGGYYEKAIGDKSFYVHIDDSVHSYILRIYDYDAEAEFARAYKSPDTLYMALKRMGGLA